MTLFGKFGLADNSKLCDENLLSIMNNLNNILNSKRGYSSFLPDFGIRDLNEYSSRDFLIPVVIEEVRKCIEQYEPRVKVINIVPVDEKDPLRISFNLECVVLKNTKSLHMVFDSVFNSFRVSNRDSSRG